MQDSNQENQQPQPPDTAKKDEAKKGETKKESAWKGASPEDVTGKQKQGAQSGKAMPRGQANQPSQNKIKDDDDADTMGSGKRQDDN
jgi:hypothetical protein